MTEIPVTVKRELTIDDLAQRVGMSVRNLREWRGLGLLPAPEKRGRVGYYGEDTVELVERIKRLHADGFPLELIRRLLDASGDATAEVTELAGALREPFREQRPPLVDIDALERQWGPVDAAVLQRAVALGVMRQRPDGRHEYTSAQVAGATEALVRLGLSPQQTLDATAEVRAHADGIAALFHRLWLGHVWDPFLAAGAPAEGLAGIQAALGELQPLALDAVVGIFRVAMEARIEAAIAEEIARAEGGA